MPKTHLDGTVSHASLGLVAVPPSVLAHALANQVHAEPEAEEGEQPSVGTSSSPSQPAPDSSATTNASGSPRRARTTGSPSAPRRKAASTARTTGGSTPATGTPPSEED